MQLVCNRDSIFRDLQALEQYLPQASSHPLPEALFSSLIYKYICKYICNLMACPINFYINCKQLVTPNKFHHRPTFQHLPPPPSALIRFVPYDSVHLSYCQCDVSICCCCFFYIFFVFFFSLTRPGHQPFCPAV